MTTTKIKFWDILRVRHCHLVVHFIDWRWIFFWKKKIAIDLHRWNEMKWHEQRKNRMLKSTIRLPSFPFDMSFMSCQNIKEKIFGHFFSFGCWSLSTGHKLTISDNSKHNGHEKWNHFSLISLSPIHFKKKPNDNIIIIWLSKTFSLVVVSSTSSSSQMLMSYFQHLHQWLLMVRKIINHNIINKQMENRKIKSNLRKELVIVQRSDDDVIVILLPFSLSLSLSVYRCVSIVCTQERKNCIINCTRSWIRGEKKLCFFLLWTNKIQ